MVTSILEGGGQPEIVRSRPLSSSRWARAGPAAHRHEVLYSIRRFKKSGLRIAA
ncbi:MAG: hypothetical protein V3S87_01920 [Alphaproteobacteria bacterium]